MNETMVTVTGNVAGDVITKRVGSNQEHLLVTFRVASSERRYDRATDTWVDGDRFTALVNCWRRLADGARMLVKGDPVVVTGRLSVREYEVEGVRRYMTEIAATAVGPDLGRCVATVAPGRPGVGESAAAGAPGDGGVGSAEVAAGERAPGSDEPAVVGEQPPGGAVVAGPAEEEDSDEDSAGDGATVTGIAVGERRRAGAGRATA